MESVLLIDDKQPNLEQLTTELQARISEEKIEIRGWSPKSSESDPKAVFDSLVDDSTLLVVTDYDLTAQGCTGLFGASIVGWCQSRLIPVGEFSRIVSGALPKEPSLFELRFPNDTREASRMIAGIARGFNTIRKRVSDETETLTTKRSPATVLAHLLGVPELESQLSLYGLRFGASSPTLIEQLKKTAAGDVQPNVGERSRLLSYIVGHILLTTVLRFSGPILSRRALLAYVACADAEAEAICELFSDSAYDGPFSELDSYFWLFKVDARLDEFSAPLPAGFSTETVGEWNRASLELHLGRQLARDSSCGRCNGLNGGFLCPFTSRTVCQRDDCSVGSNSWIPQGAKLCRIERDFYDEWAPILGI